MTSNPKLFFSSYTIGINVFDENSEFKFYEEDKDSKALIAMPSFEVLKALDQNSNAKSSQTFIVGVVNEENLQDPFGFNSNPLDDPTSRGTRPRGGGEKNQQKNNQNKHKSLKDELDDIVNKAANFIERKFGNSLMLNRSFDDEDQELCDPDSMEKTQIKCMVRFVI